MAYKTLIFGTDDLYEKLKPFYEKQVELGNLEIVATAELQKDSVNITYVDGIPGGGVSSFDLAIVSSKNDFYNRMKQLETFGIPRAKIIDGRVFAIPGLDFPRFLKEGIAYGVCEKIFPKEPISRFAVYPRFYTTPNKRLSIKLGVKSSINGCRFDSDFGTYEGALIVGNFCSISWGETFGFYDSGNNPAYGHHPNYVGTFHMWSFDWEIPQDIFISDSRKQLQIKIGNDVWIGRGCILKTTNPNKPLVVGDGAIIAADSVVAKNVPPYAIVGGNPAQVIKYRFPPHIIEAFLRIKWWDWSLDKIHDNFKYFNDVEKFISLHDK